MHVTSFDALPLEEKERVLVAKITALRLVAGNEARVKRREQELAAVRRAMSMSQNGTLALGFDALGAKLPSCYAPTTPLPPKPTGGKGR